MGEMAMEYSYCARCNVRRQRDAEGNCEVCAMYRKQRAAQPGLSEGQVRAKALEEAAEIIDSHKVHLSEYTSPHDAWVNNAVKCRDAIRALAASQASPQAGAQAAPLGEERRGEDTEAISAKVHEQWMETKRAKGVVSRKSESGEELMVPYAQLSEAAKDLDRGSVRAVLEAQRAQAEAQAAPLGEERQASNWANPSDLILRPSVDGEIHTREWWAGYDCHASLEKTVLGATTGSPVAASPQADARQALKGEDAWVDEIAGCQLGSNARAATRTILRAFAANLKTQLAAAPLPERAGPSEYPYGWKWMRLRGYLKEWLAPKQYDVAKECLEAALAGPKRD